MILTVNTSLISHIGSTVLLTLFLILILSIAVCAILSFVPKRPYLDRSSGLIVQPFLILSSPLRFPLSRIQIKDMPEGLMEHLSVINHGCLNIFGIYSGTFRSTRDKAPVYIYLRNRRPFCLYFAYSRKSMTFRTLPQDSLQQISGTFDVSVLALFQ